MQTRTWDHVLAPGRQLESLVEMAARPGVLVLEVAAGGDGSPCPWTALEPWTRSRAVTVADLDGAVASPALEVALTCDLVVVRQGAVLLLPGPEEAVPAGVLWALGRAGRPALSRGLLQAEPLTASAAVELGLAHALLAPGERVPVPRVRSRAALTTARDLMRAQGGERSRLALELASFRFLFAVGDPEEGARAFLEDREARFPGERADGGDGER